MTPTLSAVIGAGLSGYKRFLVWAAVFSVFVNTLTLGIPLYTIQVFDRVLPSGSGATLVVLTIAVLGGIAAANALEEVRARLLISLGIQFDAQLSKQLFERLVERDGDAASVTKGGAVRDLDTVRHALTGSAILTLFDLPWTPLFLLACFYLHPVLGIISLGGALLVIGLAVLNQVLVGQRLATSAKLTEESYRLTEGVIGNAETVRAMGMLPELSKRWSDIRVQAIGMQADASAGNSSVSSVIKFVRYTLQVLIMGAGAWLAVGREISPGSLFAASLICTRALMPVDQLVGVWRQILSALAALGRVEEVLAVPLRPKTMELPIPAGRLSVEALSYTVPGARAPTLNDISFLVNPGESLGIVGPSAAGKSTLARLLVGAIKPTAGNVRLDGADVWSWGRAQFGTFTGYVSQNIELFEGSIAENIARFRTVDAAEIVAAARLAGVHEMILGFPKGYDTRLLASGAPLSGGQRQRIALARSVFGNPKLVVLDEPNSNLDSDGETALHGLLAALKARGTTVIMIAHRPSILVSLDKVLVLTNGAVAEFGPIARVMPRIAPGFATGQKRIGESA
ncbi:type I secretion system permease/ATPase [Hyphomicrobium sp. LHD-15]|uniref:type I secretion system permease/ATPase n=1 Tax=Hyphomicrobium sp. LHD-15 TaxID=3072142 RepID=UPI00280E5C11|nr:type I secretion system permease/ATPase [Hyphomicrobium sp. LHD-15]MDQ8699896.1 type I secretion system permease/ATPase [Hyphomicrobium sp. LHD-15]